LVSVVIPALNEERTLGVVLHSVHDVFRGMNLVYEIVVVDDGSSDGTAKVAAEGGAVLVCHGGNCGKGEALKTGFSKAKGDVIVTMDADGSHLAEDIPSLVEPFWMFDDLDVVIGTRFNDGSNRDSTSRLHLIGNNILNLTIRFLTGRRVSDSQCGFRAFRRRVLGKLVIDSSGFGVEGEMMVKMLLDGVSIREVPIRCLPRREGVSRIRTFRDGFAIFKTIVKVAYNTH